VDLVLSDFDLPTETGYEFIRKAQVVQPTLKVLLMSAWAEENIMPRPRPWDWPQFISKPFKPNALRDAVLAVLEETEQQVRSTRRRESVAHFAESEA
jgi:DNA-binding NtrC family response regulator